MKADNIKLIYTYTIALVVIVGGLYIIYETRLDPPAADVQGMRLLLAGFIGSALTFAFAQQSAAGSAVQSERAYAAGLATPTIPSVPIPDAATTTTTTSTTTAADPMAGPVVDGG